MGNRITDNLKIGTIGELLVQLRLLQFGVQAAAPLKDSGNDLVAVLGEEFRGIQVKTTTQARPQKPKGLPDRYHLLAIVCLEENDQEIFLDRSKVFLLPREAIENWSETKNKLEGHLITQHVVDRLFDQRTLVRADWG